MIHLYGTEIKIYKKKFGRQIDKKNQDVRKTQHSWSIWKEIC